MTTLDFEREFLALNPKTPFILRYLATSIGKEHVEWSDITKLNMERFSKYLLSIVSQNSARTYLAVFKSFVAKYSEENLMPCSVPQNKIKTVPSQHVALSLNELTRLDSFIPTTQTEYDVLNIFMRGCLTGARYSDAILLTADNISDGILSYVSKKTKTETYIPVHAMLSKYLAKPPYKVRGSTTTNRVIKEICRKAGIRDHVKLFVNGKIREGMKYEFITEHTSRRTFCTVLASMNVPVDTIAKMAGHSNSNITSQRYICIDTKNVGENAMRFFNSCSTT